MQQVRSEQDDAKEKQERLRRARRRQQRRRALQGLLLGLGMLSTFLWLSGYRVANGRLGAMLTRWRYQARFERQYAELRTCLDERLPAATAADFATIGSACFALAEQRTAAAPLAIEVLVPLGEGRLEWRSVRTLTSTVVSGYEHGDELREGVNLVSLGVDPSERGLVYLRTLPVSADRPAQPHGYRIVVRLAGLR